MTVETALLVLGIFSAFVVVGALLVFSERDRLRRAERRFLKNRSPMDDAAFAARLSADPAEADFHLEARRAMAELCGLNAAFIHPTDSVRSLLDLQFDGGFLADFFHQLDHRLEKSWQRLHFKDHQSFAELLRLLAGVRRDTPAKPTIE